MRFAGRNAPEFKRLRPVETSLAVSLLPADFEIPVLVRLAFFLLMSLPGPPLLLL